MIRLMITLLLRRAQMRQYMAMEQIHAASRQLQCLAMIRLPECITIIDKFDCHTLICVELKIVTIYSLVTGNLTLWHLCLNCAHRYSMHYVDVICLRGLYCNKVLQTYPSLPHVFLLQLQNSNTKNVSCIVNTISNYCYLQDITHKSFYLWVQQTSIQKKYL